MSLEHIKAILPRIIDLETLTANAELENSSFILPPVKNLPVTVTPLNYGVSLYLPANKDESAINSLKHQAALLFGGFSVLELEGGWIYQSGELKGQLKPEKILWFRVFLSFEALSYLESFLENVYQLVKDWNEESLLIEVSNNTWTKRWLVDVL
jgi:hypothetical protein